MLTCKLLEKSVVLDPPSGKFLISGQRSECQRVCVCVSVCAYLLLLQPEICQLGLVLAVQPLQLLAALFEVVVLSHQLGVVPPERLHLLLQLRLFSQDTAVQHAGGEERAQGDELSAQARKKKSRYSNGKSLFLKATLGGT